MTKRPRIQIKWKRIDYLLELAGLIALSAMLFVSAYHYRDLPEQIPTHFNASGQVDAWGQRESIWLLPGIAAIMYLLLTLLNRFPHLFNFPVKVTEANAERLYTIGTRAVRLLKIALILMMLYLNWKTISIALANQTGFSMFAIIVFLLAVTGLIAGMSLQRKLK